MILGALASSNVSVWPGISQQEFEEPCNVNLPEEQFFEPLKMSASSYNKQPKTIFSRVAVIFFKSLRLLFPHKMW